MGQRDDLYQRFGPLLKEAVLLLMLQEINILRQEAGLPERTEADMYTAIKNKVNELDDYDWMG